MAVLCFESAPDGQPCYVRCEDVAVVHAPFAWSKDVQARVLRLHSGQEVMVLATDSNLRKALEALDAGAGADVGAMVTGDAALLRVAAAAARP